MAVAAVMAVLAVVAVVSKQKPIERNQKRSEPESPGRKS